MRHATRHMAGLTPRFCEGADFSRHSSKPRCVVDLPISLALWSKLLCIRVEVIELWVWFGKGKIHGAIGGSLRILGPKRDLCCGWPGANGDCDVQYSHTLGGLPVCRDSITPVSKDR